MCPTEERLENPELWRYVSLTSHPSSLLSGSRPWRPTPVSCVDGEYSQGPVSLLVPFPTRDPSRERRVQGVSLLCAVVHCILSGGERKAGNS